MAEEKVYTTTELKTTCFCDHVDRQHSLLEGECACSGCDCKRFVALVGDAARSLGRVPQEVLDARCGCSACFEAQEAVQ